MRDQPRFWAVYPRFRHAGHRPAEAKPSFGRLAQLPQGRLHDLARIGGESGLRRDGIADVVALEGQAGLDAGRQVEAGKSLVDAPQPALERHRLVPAASLAEVVERDA